MGILYNMEHYKFYGRNIDPIFGAQDTEFLSFTNSTRVMECNQIFRQIELAKNHRMGYVGRTPRIIEFQPLKNELSFNTF